MSTEIDEKDVPSLGECSEEERNMKPLSQYGYKYTMSSCSRHNALLEACKQKSPEIVLRDLYYNLKTVHAKTPRKNLVDDFYWLRDIFYSEPDL